MGSSSSPDYHESDSGFLGPEKRLCTSEDEIAPWHDLPPELLSPIAESLGIIDLLSFRGVCKQWRTAATTASAEMECEPSTKLWLILYGDSREKCRLFNPNDGNSYTIDLPELKNATCLASNQGWLLLFQEGVVFFYCPFSRVRIDLPQFPHRDMSDHIAAFTGPPTSFDCVVSIINRRDSETLEINMIKRGETTWTKRTFEHNVMTFPTPVGGVYIDEEGIFYYFDNTKNILTFSPNEEEESFDVYRLVEQSEDVEDLPCRLENGYFQDFGMRNLIQVEDDILISISGAIVLGCSDEVCVICNARVEHSDGSAKRKMRGIWVEPRFFHIPTTQSW